MNIPIPKSVANNAFFLTMLTFSNYFMGLLLFPYISRALSVESFGLVGFSMSYVLVFQVIIEFGFMISTTAQIAKHRSNAEKVASIVSTTLHAKLILSAVSAVIFLASALIVPMLREHLLFVSLFFLSSFLSAMLPDFYFRGVEKMKTIAVRTILVRLLSLFIILLFVRDDSDIIAIPLAFVGGNLLAFIITMSAMKKDGIILRPSEIKIAISTIRTSIWFFLSRMAASLNQSTGAFFLGLKFAPSSFELGTFSAASRISVSGELMLLPVTESIYPHMVHKKDYVLFKKVLIGGLFAWFIACTVVFIFASEIVSILLGQEYESAGDYLRILLFGNFLAFPNMMFGYNALTPIGKANHANIAIMISAVLNIIVYTILWLTDSISLLSVTVVITLSNLLMLLYRGGTFLKYRHLVDN